MVIVVEHRDGLAGLGVERLEVAQGRGIVVALGPTPGQERALVSHAGAARSPHNTQGVDQPGTAPPQGEAA